MEARSRALLCAVAALAGCGGGTAAIDEPAPVIDPGAPAPGTDTSHPGFPIATDEELRAALIRTGGEGARHGHGIEVPDDLAPLLPQGVLLLSVGCLDDCFNRDVDGWHSSAPRCASAPHPHYISHDSLSCEPGRGRCKVDESHAYIFRRGERGIWLFAIVYYEGEVPAADTPAVVAYLERRDQICELYDAVRAGHVPVDPAGYVRATGQETDEIELAWEDRCGPAAQTAADADAASMDTDGLVCDETYCVDDGRHFFARRADDGTLYAIGHHDGPPEEQTGARPTQVLEQHARACRPPG